MLKKLIDKLFELAAWTMVCAAVSGLLLVVAAAASCVPECWSNYPECCRVVLWMGLSGFIFGGWAGFVFWVVAEALGAVRKWLGWE